AAAVGWVESSRPTVRGWVATSSGGPRRLDPPYSRIAHADLGHVVSGVCRPAPAIGGVGGDHQAGDIADVRGDAEPAVGPDRDKEVVGGGRRAALVERSARRRVHPG